MQNDFELAVDRCYNDWASRFPDPPQCHPQDIAAIRKSIRKHGELITRKALSAVYLSDPAYHVPGRILRLDENVAIQAAKYDGPALAAPWDHLHAGQETLC